MTTATTTATKESLEENETVFSLKIEAAIEPGNGEYRARLAKEHEFAKKAQGKKALIEEVVFPNVVYEVGSKENVLSIISGTNVKEAINNIYENIAFKITNSIYEGTYVIGGKALAAADSDLEDYQGETLKTNSKLPFISTIGTIAAYAAKIALNDESYQDGEVIEVAVKRAVTTIPVADYYNIENPSINLEYTNKYTKPETEDEQCGFYVDFYLGTREVKIDIFFDDLLVLPESVSAHYGLTNLDLKNELVQNLLGDLILRNTNIDIKEEVSEEDAGKIRDYLFQATSIHYDLGSGTTDKAVLGPKAEVLRIHTKGLQYNIYENIVKSLPELHKILQDDSYGVTHINQLLVNPANEREEKNKEEILPVIKNHLKIHAKKIVADAEKTVKEVLRAKHDLRFMYVYGGGSVLTREFIEEDLQKIANSKNIELIYTPEEFATKMNIFGNEQVLMGMIVDGAHFNVYEHLKEVHYNSK